MFNDALILTAISSWLLTYLMHSSVILLITLLLVHFSRRVSPATKDVLLKVALVAGIASASFQFYLNSTGLFHNNVVVKVFDTSSLDTYVSAVTSKPDSASTDTGSKSASNSHANLAKGSLASTHTLRWVLVIWCLGIALFSLRFAFKWHQLNKHIGARTIVSSEALLTLLDKASNDANVSGKVQLTTSKHIKSPIALGTKEICLPESFTENVNEEELLAMLGHELAHLERMDPLWLFFWHFMSIVFFFQPLNKLAQISYQANAEFLCDAIAVGRSNNAIKLVEGLIRTARLSNAKLDMSLAAALTGRKASIEARSRALLEEPVMKIKLTLPAIIVSASAITLVASALLPNLSFASLTPTQTARSIIGELPNHWDQVNPVGQGHLSNLDAHYTVSGKGTHLFAKDVEFGELQQGITRIKPGGRLVFTEKTIYQANKLEIMPTDNGELVYRFTVNDELVDNLTAATEFLQRMLDDNLQQHAQLSKALSNTISNALKGLTVNTKFESDDVVAMLKEQGLDENSSPEDVQAFFQRIGSVSKGKTISKGLSGGVFYQVNWDHIKVENQQVVSIKEDGFLNVTITYPNEDVLKIQLMPSGNSDTELTSQVTLNESTIAYTNKEEMILAEILGYHFESIDSKFEATISQ